jgi:hypothetical protein
MILLKLHIQSHFYNLSALVSTSVCLANHHTPIHRSNNPSSHPVHLSLYPITTHPVITLPSIDPTIQYISPSIQSPHTQSSHFHPWIQPFIQQSRTSVSLSNHHTHSHHNSIHLCISTHPNTSESFLRIAALQTGMRVTLWRPSRQIDSGLE